MRWLPVLFLLLLAPDCVVHKAVRLRYSERGVQAFRQFPVNWNFSCDFPQNERVYAREGFTYWNGVLGREVFKEVEGCGVAALLTVEVPRVTVLYVPSTNPVDPNVLATADVGLFDGVPRSAVLRYYRTWVDNGSPSSKQSVSRHEVGHVLGFAHSDVDGCLMYPKIDVKKYSRKPKRACKEEVRESNFIYGKKD